MAQISLGSESDKGQKVMSKLNIIENQFSSWLLVDLPFFFWKSF